MKPDFIVSGDAGSLTTVYLLRPMTDAAKAWVDDNLPEERMTLGSAVAVEHRYIGAIVEGIRNDGLVVE